MPGSIAELQAALENQNTVHKLALEVEREKTLIEAKKATLAKQRLELDAVLLKEQVQLRITIQEVLMVAKELVGLGPMLSCFGDSQALILAVLELMMQPIYSAVIKDAVSNETQQAFDRALAEIGKIRTQISVYGQVNSGRDTNVAGGNIKEKSDGD